MTAQLPAAGLQLPVNCRRIFSFGDRDLAHEAHQFLSEPRLTACYRQLAAGCWTLAADGQLLAAL